MSRLYKNILHLHQDPDPIEERANLNKEILNNSTPFPRPVDYKDYDERFIKWVDETLSISFEGTKVPTMSLFSSQRFSEYMQSWAYTDDKKNLLLNFKTVTRDNNPQKGTIYGQNMNIPGDKPYMLLGRRTALDDSGREYIIDYKMKQPMHIDFTYYVSIVTNRYTMLNEFNKLVNKQFRAIDAYIDVNGHYVSMILSNISDESEYNINDRQFFSQTYTIQVRGYIITEDDFIEEEKQLPRINCIDGVSSKRNKIEIEEGESPCKHPDESIFYVPLDIRIKVEPCDKNISFTIDEDFVTLNIETANIRNYRVYINDNEVENLVGYPIKNGDKIKIAKINLLNPTKNGEIFIEGYDPNETYDENTPAPESELDDENIREIEINS